MKKITRYENIKLSPCSSKEYIFEEQGSEYVSCTEPLKSQVTPATLI